MCSPPTRLTFQTKFHQSSLEFLGRNSFESLLEVVDNIAETRASQIIASSTQDLKRSLDVLDPDRDPDELRQDTRSLLLVGCELLVRRRRRVDDKLQVNPWISFSLRRTFGLSSQFWHLQRLRG